MDDPRGPFRLPPLASEKASEPAREPDPEPGGRRRRARRRPTTVEPAPTQPAEPDSVPQPASGRARRRRRLLGVSFLAVLIAFVGLNLSMAGQSDGTAPQPWPRSLDEAINRLRGPVRIGLQVGHLDAASQPEELASLRTSTGAHAGGVDEVDINAAIVAALAARLRALGMQVDVLPATIPPGYSADAVLSVHADANLDPARQGYKSAHFTPTRNAREPLLKVEVDRAVLLRTNLLDDDRNVSGNMLEYYAFNRRRFRHAVSRRTPALLVEMGYLSNPSDRRWLERPERVASVLESGLLGYLEAVGRYQPVDRP